MVMELHTLQNTHRPFKKRKRVGRGMGSGLGKTCGRGHKGAKARAGYKTRARYEGGQLPLYRKLPGRGFSNLRFQKKLDAINLGDIEALFADGDVVNMQSLRSVGLIKGASNGFKILSEGDITKKVRFEANAMSKKAQEKLQQAQIQFTLI
jgi:large subunit ribosomal protein L15